MVMPARPRLAIVVSHPVQYYAAWYRALARDTDLEVFFCHRQDAAGQAAAGFGVEFEWDVPLLEGYSFTWLENRARRPSVSRFSGCDTPDIRTVISRSRFDACIVSGWYLKSYVQAIRACRAAGVPVLLRGDSQLGTRRHPAWRAAKYVPYRWLLTRVSGHLYVGQANRDYLRHYGVAEDRLFFTPHFVDNDFFASRASAARAERLDVALRRSVGLPDDARVFTFVGKLIQKKRPADFVRALAAMPAGPNRPWGLIVGSGPLQSDLQALAASLDAPVRFAGFRNQTELPSCFAAADAIVLPSDAGETWGLVVNEAMACGLPAVVSTAAGCSRDLVDDGATGFRFEVGNIGGLTDALSRMDGALDHHRAAIQAAVAAKITQYSAAAAVRGTLEALNALGASRPHRGASQSTLATESPTSHAS
jgi:glycosyltransferase involved in cell wall biosynthesis